LTRRRPLILWGAIVAYSAALSVLSIARHWGFYSLEDAGAFPQMFWSTLHGKFLYTDLPGLGRFAFTPHNYLGEHFSPIILLFLPVYAAWQRPEVLLVLQSVVLGLAALPLYGLVYDRFGDRFLATSFAVAWLMSPFVWQSNIADFHPDTFQPLIIFSAFLYLFRRRARPYLAFIGLSLLCKEDAFVHVVAIGLFALVALRATAAGAYTVVLAGVWALATFKLFMPLFGGGMAYVDHYADFGRTLPAVLTTLLLEPHRVLAHLVQPAIRSAIVWILSTLAFLPLLSPLALMAAVLPAMERLLASLPHIHTLSWYYSMPVLPMLFVAALLGASNAVRLIRSDGAPGRWPCWIGALLVVATLVTGAALGFGITGPFALSMPRPTMSRDGWLWVSGRDAAIRKLLAGVPESVSVSTSPYIAAHVSGRFNLRIYPYRPLDRDVILLDLYGRKHPADLPDYQCEIVKVLSGGEYGVVEYLDGFVYLRRGQVTARNGAVAGEVASIFEAEDLHADGFERVFDLGAGNKLAMAATRRRSFRILYGPYLSLPPGHYHVVFRMASPAEAAGDIATIEASADLGGTVLAARTIRGADFRERGRYQDFALEVQTGHPLQDVEFRVHSRGRHPLRVDRINLQPGSLALEVLGSSCPR
jgi:uncharacterized membrane protein